MIKQTRLINSNGEVIKNKVHHIAAAFDEEKGYLFWARKSHAKSFLDTPYPPGMTHTEIGRIAVLAKKIWSNTNMLGYRGNGGVKPYDVEQIGKIIELGPRQAARFIDKMIKVGMMARVRVDSGGKKETQYYINPIFYFSGNRISLNLYLIFKEQLDRVLPEWVKVEYMKQSR